MKQNSHDRTTVANGQHSHAMATRAIAGGVACLVHRRWAKAAAGQGSTAARGALRPRGARRGRPSSRRGAPRRRAAEVGAATAARRRSRGGGRGIRRGKGRGGGGNGKEPHRAPESREGGPGEGVRREGRSFGRQQWWPRCSGRRFGRGAAQSSSRRGGGASGRGKSAWGASNRSGAARVVGTGGGDGSVRARLNPRA